MPAQTVIKVRRDTAANWISADPTLASGEIGFETDTNQLKIGNGSLAWTALDYTSGGASVEISETAPASPDEGNVWFNSTEGRAYIYYDSTWVDLNPGIAGPVGATGETGIAIQTSEPSSTDVLWLDTDEEPDVPVPAGGTDGQVLTKTSSADYATAWENIPEGTTVVSSTTEPEDTGAIWYNTENGNAYIYYDGFWTSISGLPSIPVGGTTGQVLAKSSNTDYATQWVAPSALTLINTTSFTAQSSVLINNVFSTDYDFYQVNSQLIGSSAQDLKIRLAAAGTPDTGSNYSRQRMLVYSTNVYEASSGTSTDYLISGYGTSNNFIYKLELANPAQAQATALMSWGGRIDMIQFQVGSHTLATAYDGLNFFTSSGTFTGSVSIYGLRK